MNRDDPSDWQGPNGRGATDLNIDCLLQWGLAVALCLFFATLYPRDLVPAVLSELLFFAAAGAAAGAALNKEPVDPPHLTHWDQAAACFALSLLLRILFPPQPLIQAAAVGS